jgi:bis(5'-nucleosyl)-tetraphosphatase (symmetrical)
MSIYFVGDIQGCFSELKALLNQVDFDKSNDQLWVAGDMVARGPDSYKTLKYLMSLGECVNAVLGNHDLHLLAIHAGIKKAKPSDCLDELLSAPDIENIVHWLAHLPLLRKLPNENTYMSHAGISPQWTIEEAEAMALRAHQQLISPNRNDWLGKMYGELPNSWHQAITDTEKFRFTINAFTRMRYCFLTGELEFNCKDSPKNAPYHIKPWFKLVKKQLENSQWVFGHWAALMGETDVENLYAIDTGCVWGQHLTLLRWDDKTLFIENSHKY